MLGSITSSVWKNRCAIKFDNGATKDVNSKSLAIKESKDRVPAVKTLQSVNDEVNNANETDYYDSNELSNAMQCSIKSIIAIRRMTQACTQAMEVKV